MAYSAQGRLVAEHVRRFEFEVWRTRDLSDVELDYLFLDGSHFKFHQGAASERVLAAWGITTEAKPVLVALAPRGLK